MNRTLPPRHDTVLRGSADDALRSHVSDTSCAVFGCGHSSRQSFSGMSPDATQAAVCELLTRRLGKSYCRRRTLVGARRHSRSTTRRNVRATCRRLPKQRPSIVRCWRPVAIRQWLPTQTGPRGVGHHRPPRRFHAKPSALTKERPRKDPVTTDHPRARTDSPVDTHVLSNTEPASDGPSSALTQPDYNVKDSCHKRQHIGRNQLHASSLEGPTGNGTNMKTSRQPSHARPTSSSRSPSKRKRTPDKRGTHYRQCGRPSHP